MRYSLGLTAVTLLAVAGIYVGGCGAPAGQGLGLLEPYSTETPGGGGGGGGTKTPTPTKTPKGSELFQNNLTNPIGLVDFGGFKWSIQYYSWQKTTPANKGVSNAAEQEKSLNCGLVAIAPDTEKGQSDTDKKSPHKIKLIDKNGEEVALNYPTGMVALQQSLVGGEHRYFYDKDSKVFNAEAGGGYFIICDGFKYANSGRIIIVNTTPEDNDWDKDTIELYCHVIYTAAANPFKVAANEKYIWWTEYNANGAVKRLQWNEHPEKTLKENDLRTYISGMIFPTNIVLNDGIITVADTQGQKVLIAPTEIKNESKSGDVITTYATNEDKEIYVLGDGQLLQPYGLKYMRDGRLLITDGSGFADSGDGPAPGDIGQGFLKIWDYDLSARKPTYKIYTVAKGLTNPQDIDIIYDATKDYTSENQQLVDVLIPQYSLSNGQSSIYYCRFDATNKKITDVPKYERLIMSNMSYVSEAFSSYHILSPNGNGDLEKLPEKAGLDFQMYYNRGFGVGENYGYWYTFTDDYPKG